MLVNTGRHGDYSHPNFATQQDLDAISAELDDVGVEHEVLQPTDGKPTAEVILQAATSRSADLIIIGLRRRSPVGKLITGSTAQQILLDAECPVLTVKARPGQLTVMSSPLTVTLSAPRGLVAGPWTTEPSLIENLLPWHLQSMSSPTISVIDALLVGADRAEGLEVALASAGSPRPSRS